MVAQAEPLLEPCYDLAVIGVQALIDFDIQSTDPGPNLALTSPLDSLMAAQAEPLP